MIASKRRSGEGLVEEGGGVSLTRSLRCVPRSLCMKKEGAVASHFKGEGGSGVSETSLEDQTTTTQETEQQPEVEATALGYASRLSANPNKGPVGIPEKRERPKAFLRKAEVLLLEVQRRLRDQRTQPRSAPPAVAHTGAGISTSAGIPDFRGPSGVWTIEKTGKSLRDAESSICEVVFGGERRAVMPFHLALPTPTHLILQALSEPQLLRLEAENAIQLRRPQTRLVAQRRGKTATVLSSSSAKEGRAPSPFQRVLDFVITQNVDGLHARCGTRFSSLAEVHGSLFVERCDFCGRRFLREFPLPTLSFNPTGHLCGLCAFPPHGVCTDVLLDWFDSYEPHFLASARRHSRRAFLHLCLGSSLQIQPACFFPSQERRRDSSVAICNLQSTPLDSQAVVCIRSPVDVLMQSLAQGLGLRGGWGWKRGGRFGGLGLAERTGFQDSASSVDSSAADAEWSFSEFTRTALVFVLRIPCRSVAPLIRAEGGGSATQASVGKLRGDTFRKASSSLSQSFLLCAPCCISVETDSSSLSSDANSASAASPLVKQVDKLRGVWHIQLFGGNATLFRLRFWYETRADLHLRYEPEAAGVEADVWQIFLASTPKTHASSLPPSITTVRAMSGVLSLEGSHEETGGVSHLPSETVALQPPFEPLWPVGVSVRKARLVAVLTAAEFEVGGERQSENAPREGLSEQQDFTIAREVRLPLSLQAVYNLHCLSEEWSACNDDRDESPAAEPAKAEPSLNDVFPLTSPDASSSNASTDTTTPKKPQENPTDFSDRQTTFLTVETGSACAADEFACVKTEILKTPVERIGVSVSQVGEEDREALLHGSCFSSPRKSSCVAGEEGSVSSTAARRRAKPSKRLLERDERLPRNKKKLRNVGRTAAEEAAATSGFQELCLPSLNEEMTLPTLRLQLKRRFALRTEGPSPSLSSVSPSLSASFASGVSSSPQRLFPRLMLAKDWTLGCLAEEPGLRKGVKPARRFHKGAARLASADTARAEPAEDRRIRLARDCSALASKLLAQGSGSEARMQKKSDGKSLDNVVASHAFVEASAGVWRSLKGLPLWTLNFLVDLLECV